MARDKGWKPNYEISFDGQATWFELEEMTAINPDNAPQTETVRTINGNGRPETEILSVDTKFEITGFFAKQNTTWKQVERSIARLDYFDVRYTPIKDMVDNYLTAKVIATGSPRTHEAEGLAGYTLNVAVEGSPQYVGDI